MAEQPTVRILELRNLDRLDTYLSRSFKGWKEDFTFWSALFLVFGTPIYGIVCAVFSFKFIWAIPLIVLICALFFPSVYVLVSFFATTFFRRWSAKVHERYEITEVICEVCGGTGGEWRDDPLAPSDSDHLSSWYPCGKGCYNGKVEVGRRKLEV